MILYILSAYNYPTIKSGSLGNSRTSHGGRSCSWGNHRTECWWIFQQAMELITWGSSQTSSPENGNWPWLIQHCAVAFFRVMLNSAMCKTRLTTTKNTFKNKKILRFWYQSMPDLSQNMVDGDSEGKLGGHIMTDSLLSLCFRPPCCPWQWHRNWEMEESPKLPHSCR